MNKFLNLGFSLFLIGILTSCINEHTDWSRCLRAIRLEIHWIDTEPLERTEEVNLTIDHTAGDEMRLLSPLYGRYLDLLAGHYTIIGKEIEDNVTIDAQKATLSIPVGADGMAYSPAPFSAGMTTADIVYQPDTLVIPLPMYRQTRPLVIEIRMTGKRTPIINEFPVVEQFNGVLKGITVERDLWNCFPPHDNKAPWPALRSGQIGYEFALQTDTIPNEVWYSGMKNLIGVDNGNTQILDLEVKFQGMGTMDFSFDVTELMDEFQTKEVSKPWYILITLSLDSSLNVDIEDWIAGPDSWLIAR